MSTLYAAYFCFQTLCSCQLSAFFFQRELVGPFTLSLNDHFLFYSLRLQIILVVFYKPFPSWVMNLKNPLKYTWKTGRTVIITLDWLRRMRTNGITWIIILKIILKWHHDENFSLLEMPIHQFYKITGKCFLFCFQYRPFCGLFWIQKQTGLTSTESHSSD